jgi:hypothetical protein
MASDAQPDPRPEVPAEQATPPATAPIENRPGESPVSGGGGLGEARRQDASTTSKPQAGAGPLATLRDLVDRLLVADVFVVLAGALWFALAVLLHSRGVEAPLRLFQTLWQPLFTPAIGLLMAAALLSGALGWWQRRGPGGVRGTGS